MPAGRAVSEAEVRAFIMDRPPPARHAASMPEPAKAAAAASGASGPRAGDGEPDDLKQIAGIGPWIEGQLKRMGVTRFAQIAAWTETDVERIAAEIASPVRIHDDDWIGQARLLATSGHAPKATASRSGNGHARRGHRPEARPANGPSN